MIAIGLELYAASENETFSEGRVVRETVRLGLSPVKCSLMGPVCDAPVSALRIDFGDRPSTFLLHSLEVVAPDESVLFTWDGGMELFDSSSGMRATTADGTVLVECLTDDPQLIITLAPNTAIQVGVRFTAAIALTERAEDADITALADSQAELARAVRSVDDNTRRLLDQILIEQNDISRSLLEARNASRNLGDDLGARVRETLAAVQALEAVQNGLQEVRQHMVERDEREAGRNASLEGALTVQLERTEGAILDRIGDNATRVETYVGEAQQALYGLIETITTRLELQSRRAEIRTTEQREADDQARAEAAQKIAEILRAIESQGGSTISTVTGRLDRTDAAFAAREELTRREVAMTRNALLAQASATEQRLEAIEAAIADRALLDATRSELDKAVQASAADRALLDATRRELDKAVQASIADRALLDAARGEIDQLKAELGCIDLPVSTVVSEIHRLRVEAHEHQRVTQALVASTSWKITRPIRVLRRLVSTGRLRAPRSPAVRSPEPGPSDSDGISRAISSQWTALPTPQASVADELSSVRLIAFYLPQFHAIPENDEWWGEGFTEWTNVRRAKPQFVGHEQPHVPGDLGYYDLNDKDVQVRQARLAQQYGLGGFCFYFYWFGGKRLLEMPIQTFAENPDITLPFCLCWANENWSRRWDGNDSEILIAQSHSPEDDLAFIEHLSIYLRNPRYIRIGGKPLVMVYRPGLLPNARATAERWRRWCRQNGVGEIYLAYTQSFESVDPAEYGFDAAVEFPPNNTAPPIITDSLQKLNPDFSGIVYDYRVYPLRSEAYVTPDYKLHRGVFPAWDNEARRTGRGAVFHNSSPALYRRWLRNALINTVRTFAEPDQRLVFVNAWNEWAEGAHLEPDERYGYAYLDATRAALYDSRNRPKLVLVTHDAYRHGAQYLALNLARWLCEQHGVELRIVVLGDGPMVDEFAQYGTVFNLAGVDPLGVDARELAASFKAEGVLGAICNTTVSGFFLSTLVGAGVRCIALIHEMQVLIRDFGLEAQARAIVDHADRIIFPSSVVEASFASVVQLPADRVLIRSQGLYKKNGSQTAQARADARARLRAHFGLSPETKIVIGVGFGDRRKGLDLFVEIGAIMMGSGQDVVFVWVGDIAVDLARDVSAAITASNHASRFKMVGFQAATDDFYAGADVYALTSREDPFPTVVMEALDVNVPVVAFEGAGGSVELLRGGCGLVAPAGDTTAFVAEIQRLFDDPAMAAKMGRAGKERVDFEFSFARYVDDLKAMLDPAPTRVSVVVPNFNYANYLPERLASITAQSQRLHEIILLDDASSDHSLEVAETIRPSIDTPMKIIPNPKNSGSVFRQWLKGVEACAGDLVWIAEADDLADPEFLKTVCKAFDDPDVVMSFCQSKQMDEHGHILCDHYLDYVADIGASQWTAAYVADGLEEIRLRLAVKNTIPNVSAVVFRKEALLACLRAAIDDIASYRNAGDWVAYINLLKTGKIAFSPDALNMHRRHQKSVTLGAFNESQLREILKVQTWVAEEFGVPPGVSKIAANYAEDLYSRFGLATAPGMSLRTDPRLSSMQVGN